MKISPALSLTFPDETAKNTSNDEFSFIFTDNPVNNWWSQQPKEQKLLYSNIATIGFIGLWGYLEWDYQANDLNIANEGWFGKDTKFGGADKLGHFWASYTIADSFSGLYKNWGYPSNKANLYGAFSAWVVQAAMELGDMSSDTQGFSWEDIVMNTLGVFTSILFEKYPDIDRKIDFRLEYTFNERVNGIFDDYSNMSYSMAVKLAGFDFIQNPILRYLEVHTGYYSRGYGDHDTSNDSRSVFVGLSFNFSHLLSNIGYEKTSKVLEYIQPPYTVLKANHVLD